MLSALLDSIKSQFGSKSYWLGCMLPLILFLAANAWVAYPHCQWIGDLLPQVDSWDQKTLKYGAMLALLLAVAYILSTTTAVQLRMIEGTVPPLSWFSQILCPVHARALRTLDSDFREARDSLFALEDSRERWLRMLERSAEAGEQAPPLAKGQTLRASGTIAKLMGKQEKGLIIELDELRRAVAELSVDLASYRRGKKGDLFDAEINLRSALQYAMDRYKFDVRRLQKRRQVNFPGVRLDAPDPPEGGVAIDLLAPTAMGNIGRTIGTYSLVRYGMDLDIFWTRLQSSLQKDSKDYYTVLQDSKVQVDSMVTMFWFSVLFTLYWANALVFYFQDATVREFLTVSISGTVSVVAFYLLACEAYRVFADVMRASVDLMRFQVLQALHLSLPAGIDEEKDLWFRLGNATGFLEPESFQYKHPS
jgi:hypothetical protein